MFVAREDSEYLAGFGENFPEPIAHVNHISQRVIRFVVTAEFAFATCPPIHGIADVPAVGKRGFVDIDEYPINFGVSLRRLEVAFEPFQLI